MDCFLLLTEIWISSTMSGAPFRTTISNPLCTIDLSGGWIIARPAMVSFLGEAAHPGVEESSAAQTADTSKKYFMPCSSMGRGDSLVRGRAKHLVEVQNDLKRLFICLKRLFSVLLRLKNLSLIYKVIIIERIQFFRLIEQLQGIFHPALFSGGISGVVVTRDV